MERIRSIRGVQDFTLRWQGESKTHLKWSATCTDPNKNDPIYNHLTAFGNTPANALRKLAEKLNIKDAL